MLQPLNDLNLTLTLAFVTFARFKYWPLTVHKLIIQFKFNKIYIAFTK